MYLANETTDLRKCKARCPIRLLAYGLVLAIAAFGLTGRAEAKVFAYVFDDQFGKVSVIDLNTRKLIATRDVGLRIRWFSSRFFDGKRVWAVDGDPNKAEIVVFDPWTLKTLKRIPFGKGPSFSVELAPDRRFAITAAAGSDEVVVIDTSTYGIVRRIPVGRFPCDLTLSADGSLAFEPDREQDTVSVVDWKSGRVVKTVQFERGAKPHMLTLSPDGKSLWVQERDASRVSVMDTVSFARLARLPVGKMPATNEFSPTSPYTVSTHIGGNVVKVFDSSSYKEIKTIKVGKSPVNSVFAPDGRTVYVTNRMSGTVSLIDTGNWSVIETIAVGGKPFGIYLFDPDLGAMTGNR
jgi:YVTN family beta-propeller protein